MKIVELKSRLPLLVNTIFSLVFFVHVAIIGYGIKYPEDLSTKTYKKELNEFPVSFKICVKELVNSQDRYKKFGYQNIWSFYRGMTDKYSILLFYTNSSFKHVYCEKLNITMHKAFRCLEHSCQDKYPIRDS